MSRILRTILFCTCLLGSVNIFAIRSPFRKVPPKKIITISPSGLHGYYLLGITSYLKDHFDLKNYVFSGASAGAWISLIMSYKGNHRTIIRDVLETSEQNKGSIQDLGKGLKYLFLGSGKYKDRDFDLKSCYMGLIDISAKQHPTVEARTFIYNNFTTLEDAVNCCIASSHVPFVMGHGLRKFRDRYTMDGGFSNNPYYGLGHIDGNCLECQVDKEPTPAELHIHPFIWYKRPVYIMEYLSNQFKLFLDLFTISKMNITKIYQEGYEDARKHHMNFRQFDAKYRGGANAPPRPRP